MLEASLVVNFLLFGCLVYYMDKASGLVKNLSDVATPKIYGSRTAWHQYHYVLYTYSDLLKYNIETKRALNEMWMDIQAGDFDLLRKPLVDILAFYKEKRSVFSRDWSNRNFPKYGPNEIKKLTEEFSVKVDEVNYYG